MRPPNRGRMAHQTFTLATDCAPCTQLAATDFPAPARLAAGELDTPPTPGRSVAWHGPIGLEGHPTGDGRMIEVGALRWENLPIPFRLVVSDVGAHDGAVSVGRITTITRRDDGTIWGEGDIDVSSPAGAEAARLIGGGIQDGVSMDLDDVSFEIRVPADQLDNTDSDDGPPVEDDEGRVVVLDIDSGDELMVTTGARIRAATLVAVPAFAEARVSLSDSDLAPATDSDEPALVAAAPARDLPPAAWFTDPELDGPTPFTVTSDGRVYGHLALWDTCHVSFTQAGQCVNPPRSATGYAHYRLGATITREGTEVATGPITMRARHATRELGAAATLAHYEDTGLAAADVAAGEDRWGIWVAGAVRPGLGEDDLRALRAAPLSGDWRRIGPGLELVAALAVNTPGFPVPRTAGLVASGRMVSLVASGMLAPPREAHLTARVGEGLAPQDVAYLSRLARRGMARDRGVVDQMAARLRAGHALALWQRVQATTGRGE